MQKSKLSWFLKLMLALSLAFLYIPLVVLVIYSFNESKLVTVWGGFSTKWYGALLENDTILEAAWLSLRIAVVSSLAAVVLGTLAAMRWRVSNAFAAARCLPV
ncbi:putative spermidine/putrescine transport system permease [Neisseria gonorrhoeae]|uniref:Putative spermidine/putrescine transport system permease n=1 Tax=Neisseria gonorrhoeae TaxID=485 RepID=A0A378W0F0_NEIGO|nr:putative spermidine/putrescine transport system permease [Neisseria gonorrhoeae]